MLPKRSFSMDVARTLVLGFVTAIGLAQVGRAADNRKPTHPLDPLTKDEITIAVQTLRSAGKINDGSRLPLIALNEPLKKEVLAFKLGTPLRREAFVIVYERSRNQTFEATIDVAKRTVIAFKKIDGVQAPTMAEDFELVEEVVKADPRWQQAMQKRGIADFKEVHVDAWPAGDHGVKDQEGMRLSAGVSLYKGKAKNYYARPIEGVVAWVNLNTGKVFKFIDTGVVPIPPNTGDYDPTSVGQLRKAPKPLVITQPQGPSFEVNGHEIRWQKWRFRYSFHPREGLVLHTVGYEDQGRVRPILYRASLAELFVPYGDPDVNWSFRSVFDMGDTGLGWLANKLEVGADAPGNASYQDATIADGLGVPKEMPRAVAIYERDGGLLWKHFDYETNESRRARQLVISFIATAGNYEYCLNWVFHQDGTLENETLLTGIMAAKGVDDTKAAAGEDRHGHRVAPNVEAVHHQHFFNFRLDMDVEGPEGNSVVELNTVAAGRGIGHDQKNQSKRTSIMVKETVLRSEQEGRRQMNLASARRWKVINPSVKNSLGQPVGYALIPGENTVSFVAPDSPRGKKAGFIDAHLWVTPYDPVQRYPAGDYVDRQDNDDGLPEWIKANRPIENEDIVLWYTMGVTHIPRPEEWPVMTVHKAGFKLIPSGFFSRNPALDLPRAAKPKPVNKSTGAE